MQASAHLSHILEKIIESPQNADNRTIHIDRQPFKQVYPLPGVRDLLEACGFSHSQGHLVMQPQFDVQQSQEGNAMDLSAKLPNEHLELLVWTKNRLHVCRKFAQVKSIT